MKTHWIRFVLAVGLVFSSITCHAQGNLTPPGAPSPTMKSLDQIEARTPISSAPFTISKPGSYYLTTNLTVTNGNAITIATNGVGLDMNRFTISSTASTAAGNGVLINGGLRNITIVNGFIQSGVTNNGSGVYSGSGFQYGINCVGNAPANVAVSGVSVSGCLDYGIDLGSGSTTLVESCLVQTMGGTGLIADTIKNSIAMDCGGTAIQGDQVSDCRGQTTGGGEGIYATSSAQNCYAYSSSGYGLYTLTALNCNAYSSAAYYAAIFADTAENCYGQSTSSGYGILANVALNCYGSSSSSGYGIYAYYLANGCYGYAYSGTGLYALIANVCHGSTVNGTAFAVTHNVNSF